MLRKFTVLENFLKNSLNCIKCQIFKDQASNCIQYHSGGDDYKPPKGTRTLGDSFNDNPNNAVIWAYQDDVTREAAEGEKRLYAVNSSGEVVSSVWLKNTGEITVSGSVCNVTVAGICNLNASTVNVNAEKTNLGIGGKIIARDGDSVVNNKIVASGVNTSV
jgi:hypothetical protein